MPERGDAGSMSLAFEAADTPLFVVSLEGSRFRFARVNRSFLKATGLERRQVEGRLVRDVIPEPSASLVLANYKKALRGRRTVRWEETSTYPAGEKVGEVAVTPMKDRNGRFRLLAGIVHDVTARKAAQRRASESEAMFAKAFYDNPTAMAIRRVSDDVIVAVNRSFERLFGRSSRETIGRTVGGLGVYPTKAQRRRAFEFANARDSMRGFEAELRRKDGATLDVLIGFDRISFDGKDCFLATFVDITDRKRAEKALLEVSRSSQSRSRQLETLAAALVSTEQRERRRLAAIVHESLQQQLVAVAMQLKLLANARGTGSRNLKAAQEVLAQAQETTRTLSREISPPAPFQAGFPAVMRWLAEQMGRMHRLEVELRVPARLPRLPDSTQGFLFGAVRELLFNCVKHSKARRALVVIAAAGGKLRIAVSDRGVGFDAAELEKTVSGIGLISIRESLAVLGGALEIAARKGCGCRASIVVPLPKHLPPV